MISLWISSLLLWAATPSTSAPIPWEMVDMTYVFDETTLNWPTQKKFEMRVIMNETTSDGYWLQLEEYSSAIHAGTHMDAPCHFVLGKWCVDDIPLERLSGPAAVVDITDKVRENPDATVSVNDLKDWESISGRSLNGTIVVMRSGWGRRWGDREAYIGTLGNDTKDMHFPGMSPKAAQWLVDNRDVYGVASESLSLDAGQNNAFMAHRILLGNNIYGLENVANVEEIPIVGAYIYASPMKLGRGSGAPTRIVAKYPKVTFKPKDGKSVTERSLREVIIFS
jgi:kynurenine formamidase